MHLQYKYEAVHTMESRPYWSCIWFATFIEIVHHSSILTTNEGVAVLCTSGTAVLCPFGPNISDSFDLSHSCWSRFKLCKIAKYVCILKSHCGPDRKQERNGVDLSKMTVTDEIKNEFAGIFLDHQKWIMDWENFLRKWWLFMFTFENYKMGGVGFRSPPPEISINWHKKIMRNSSIIFCVV